jgi:tripartite-type tricarboxylate transporter receptor subunit TctC
MTTPRQSMRTARAARRTLCVATLAAAVAALAWPLTGAAQTWPTRPIRLLVGFAPGGGTDIVARALAPRMSELLGQQVVVENRAGASGTIAADLVAKAPSDGYTLLMGHANSNAIAPHVLPKVPFDAITDFTPITYVGYVPNVLVVYPGLPAKSVEELIALARAKPGTLTYASSGVGSTQHLAGALFNQLSGTQMNHVPYKGSSQAVVDLIAGQVSANFDTMPPVLEHVRSGKLRALAISTPQRLTQLADVPTFAEKGITGFDVTNWYSVMGPKGLPKAIVDAIDDAVKKSMADPQVRAKLDPQGVQFSGPRTPEEFREFIRAENVKYARMVKELNIKAD